MKELTAIIKDFPVLNVNIGRIQVNAGGEFIPTYEGDYIVIPSVEPQSLSTKNTKMAQDLGIAAIPYAEVSNTAGGTTVTIG